MYLVDTNIHAAYLLQNFEDNKITKDYLNLYETITLADRIVPDFIAGEFETFIMQVVPSRYKLEGNDRKKLRSLALDYLQGLSRECTMVVPEVETFKRAWELYFKNCTSHYLSFVDCLILATAEQNKYTILTKDVRLSTVAKQLDIPLLKPTHLQHG